MWYKIRLLPYDSLFDNYLCYDANKGFYLGTRSQSRFFLQEHINYDDRLKNYLKDKKYVIEECKGQHSFLIYRGNIET